MKILITGASGLLGKKFVAKLSNHIVLGVSSSGSSGTQKVDIASRKEVDALFERFKPELVIHTAAMTSVDGCDENIRSAYDTNVTGTLNVVEASRAHGSRLFYFSTDYVFSGSDTPYHEDARADPLGFYGITKYLGERIVTSLMPQDGTICRVGILYGYNDPEDKLTEPRAVVETLRAGKEFVVHDHRVKYPTLIDDVVDAVMRLDASRLSGTYHLIGNQAGGRYDWALAVADAFDLDRSLITLGNPKEQPNRPHNVQLLNTRAPHITLRGYESGAEALKRTVGDSW